MKRAKCLRAIQEGISSSSPKCFRFVVLLLHLLNFEYQNLSNGVEFGKKEQFMMCMNELIRSYKDKMEKYFETVINFSSKQTVNSEQFTFKSFKLRARKVFLIQMQSQWKIFTSSTEYSLTTRAKSFLCSKTRMKHRFSPSLVIR